jgi:hypothetical protein
MSRKQRRAHLQSGHQPQPVPKAVQIVRQELVVDDDCPPIPDVDDVDCAFPTRWRELLPPLDRLTKDERNMRGPFCEALSSIFFRGGRLEDHGIQPKPGVEMRKVYRYVRATLGDFGPPHEHKIGGIAHMLAKWCTVETKRKGGPHGQ